MSTPLPGAITGNVSSKSNIVVLPGLKLKSVTGTETAKSTLFAPPFAASLYVSPPVTVASNLNGKSAINAAEL